MIHRRKILLLLQAMQEKRTKAQIFPKMMQFLLFYANFTIALATFTILLHSEYLLLRTKWYAHVPHGVVILPQV